MINLEIKFSVFEVLKFYLFFWKTKALWENKRTDLKTFVSHVHIEVIQRDQKVYILLSWSGSGNSSEWLTMRFINICAFERWIITDKVSKALLTLLLVSILYLLHLFGIETSKFHSNRASSWPHSLLSQFIIICLPLASGK